MEVCTNRPNCHNHALLLHNLITHTFFTQECSKKFSIVLNPSLASGGEPVLVPRLTTQLSAKQRAWKCG